MELNRIIGYCVICCFLLTSPVDGQESANKLPLGWKCLCFGTKQKDEKEYRLNKVEFSIPQNKNAPWENGILDDDDAEISSHVITNRSDLDYLEKVLSSFLVLNNHGFQAATPKQGEILLVTTHGQFKVAITGSGFANRMSNDKIFFSWGLAKLLDDVARENSKSGIKKEVIDVLSGLRWIQRDQRLYRKEKRLKTDLDK